MERAHDGMTVAQRRMLAFWLDVHGWQDWYVDLNGELPVPDFCWHEELSPRDAGTYRATVAPAEPVPDDQPDERAD
jgi:hypothetical protein